MPRKKAMQPSEGHFGKRLASFRLRAGLSQQKFAGVSGISARMIGYYETRAALPLGHVLAALAEALGITVDELVGKKVVDDKKRGAPVSKHLARRVPLMEKLPLKDKRELFSIIDTYLAKNQLFPTDEQR
jgi:transcriptional regulator with XRE-family HTH domain